MSGTSRCMRPPNRPVERTDWPPLGNCQCPPQPELQSTISGTRPDPATARAGYRESQYSARHENEMTREPAALASAETAAAAAPATGPQRARHLLALRAANSNARLPSASAFVSDEEHQLPARPAAARRAMLLAQAPVADDVALCDRDHRTARLTTIASLAACMKRSAGRTAVSAIGARNAPAARTSAAMEGDTAGGVTGLHPCLNGHGELQPDGAGDFHRPARIAPLARCSTELTVQHFARWLGRHSSIASRRRSPAGVGYEGPRPRPERYERCAQVLAMLSRQLGQQRVQT
jgi:hypothetical protein